jgi:hypothetical protein
MLSKLALTLAAAATLGLPATAEARSHRDRDGSRWSGHHDRDGRYRDRNYGSRYQAYSYARPVYRTRVYSNYGYSYGYPSSGYGYGYPSYGYGYGAGYPVSGYGYGYPSYGSGYGGGYYRDRCGNPVAGAAIGGVAGAVIGSQVASSRHHGYYRNRSDRTTGAIVGGALGAVVGGVIASGNC